MLFASLILGIVQEWCGQHNKILDFQFSFFPGRSTLQPLFLLWQLAGIMSQLCPRKKQKSEKTKQNKTKQMQM
jgi:hypothetical protein